MFCCSTISSCPQIVMIVIPYLGQSKTYKKKNCADGERDPTMTYFELSFRLLSIFDNNTNTYFCVLLCQKCSFSHQNIGSHLHYHKYFSFHYFFFSISPSSPLKYCMTIPGLVQWFAKILAPTCRQHCLHTILATTWSMLTCRVFCTVSTDRGERGVACPGARLVQAYIFTWFYNQSVWSATSDLIRKWLPDWKV